MPTALTTILDLAKTWPEWAQEELAQLAREIEAEVNAGVHRLPAADFDRCRQALDNPPEPNERLRDLIARKPPWSE